MLLVSASFFYANNFKTQSKKLNLTRKEFLLSKAKSLLTAGLNVIAVDKQKKAVTAWKQFSEDKITVSALTEQINSQYADGIAVICGGVSGGLEVIDFDLKYSLTTDLMERFNAMLPADLLSRFFIVKTRSNGYHYYYRCEVIEGNKKLASRAATMDEKKENPHVKQFVLIETRGEGGYVVAPPSDGYEITQDVPIPLISIDEREMVLDAARSFMEIHSEEKARFTSSGTPFVVSPFDDFNTKADAVSLLLRHGWSVARENSQKVFVKRPGNTKAKDSGNFHKEKNLLYVWTSSTEFEPGKAYSPAAIYAILTHGGDFSAAAKQLIKEGYGTLKTPETTKKALLTPLEIDCKFWEVVETKKGGTKIEVSLTKLVNFIHIKGGFTGYKYNAQSENIIVQVKDGLVKEVDMYDIKQFLKNEVLALPDTFDGITPDELLEVVYREYLSYLSKGFMDFLSVSKLDFLRDTPTSAFFPFKNGIIEVTKDGGKFHKYGEFKKVIWASQMIDKNIQLTKDFASNLDLANIDFCQFVKKAAGDTQEKFEYFISVLGYLLHKHKDAKQSFAVILAEESESEADGGGTGKGLFVKGVKELIPTEIFDGKQFSPGKSFAFQRVSLDTKLIAIEDAKRGFKFEEMYSFITEGLPVEKKNQKEFFIPFEDCPKITISTNYVISDEGNHAKRRQKVLEFSNYFSPARTPFDEFGRMLFTDWDGDEWNRFYNFMFFCTQVFLEGGVLQVDQSESNKVKNIKLKYGEDLLLFFGDLQVRKNETIIINEIYNEFLNAYSLNSKDYTNRRFCAGLRYISEMKGVALNDGAKTIEGRTHKVLKFAA